MERPPIDVQKILPTKKITREEANEMQLFPFGKKHPIRVLIAQLEPGELLNISRLDFNWRRQTPMRFCNEVSRSSHKKFKMLKKRDRTGWVVERVE